MSSIRLTDREREALAFIRRFSADHGYPPTIMEVAEGSGVTGTVARERMNMLIIKGYVTREHGRSRSIVAIRDEDGNPLHGNGRCGKCTEGESPDEGGTTEARDDGTRGGAGR